MTSDEVEKFRRQNFIDGESYIKTLKNLADAKAEFEGGLSHPNITAEGRLTSWGMIASYEWWIFQINFTAGVTIVELEKTLDAVIEAYEKYSIELRESPNVYEEAVFNIDRSLDDYVDYLNLLSAIILLRRVDLLQRAADLLLDTPVYQQDTIIEDLLRFFLPNRPVLEESYWEKPYQLLIDALEADSPEESALHMKKYVKKWYPSMKGQASFWGKHEQITAEYSPYLGYWAMCSAVFTYLLALDDASYRSEVVYPSDLVEYAKSLPKESSAEVSQLVQLRVIAGNPCTRTGYWFTPAGANSRAEFSEGEVMPKLADSDYGVTIWQWSDRQ